MTDMGYKVRYMLENLLSSGQPSGYTLISVSTQTQVIKSDKWNFYIIQWVCFKCTTG